MKKIGSYVTIGLSLIQSNLQIFRNQKLLNGAFHWMNLGVSYVSFHQIMYLHHMHGQIRFFQGSVTAQFTIEKVWIFQHELRMSLEHMNFHVVFSFRREATTYTSKLVGFSTINSLMYIQGILIFIHFSTVVTSHWIFWKTNQLRKRTIRIDYTRLVISTEFYIWRALVWKNQKFRWDVIFINTNI